MHYQVISKALFEFHVAPLLSYSLLRKSGAGASSAVGGLMGKHPVKSFISKPLREQIVAFWRRAHFRKRHSCHGIDHLYQIKS